MLNCMRCHRACNSGIICGECASKELALPYFIDRMAEDIAIGIPGSCNMCVIGECSGQVSGMTCRNGIKTWLLNKAKEYHVSAEQEDGKYFAFLDGINRTASNDAHLRNQLERAFPYLGNCVDGANAIVSEWRARRKSA